MPQEKIDIITDILKVFGVHSIAMMITFSDVEFVLKITSLIIAITYGIWKFRVDYLKNKNGNNSKEN